MELSAQLFVDELVRLKSLVWRRVNASLPRRFPNAHYRMVAEYPKRQGKYFRPALVLLGAELFGADKKEAIGVAAAMQLSEEWLLAHDDVEDHSLIRRKGPTLNASYGYELAINAGDALHVLMWRVLGEAIRGFDPRTARRLYEKMNDILLHTIEGQFLELDRRRQASLAMSEKEYFQMISLKSAYYTVTGPLQLGAIIANASEAALKRIDAWGMPFGCAFQISDDVLGIASRQSGKDHLGDVAEGKHTLLLAYLVQHASLSVQKRVAKIYAKGINKKSMADKVYVRDVMVACGSIAYAQERSKALAALAEKRFLRDTASYHSAYAQKILLGGMRFVVERHH